MGPLRFLFFNHVSFCYTVVESREIKWYQRLINKETTTKQMRQRKDCTKKFCPCPLDGTPSPIAYRVLHMIMSLLRLQTWLVHCCCVRLWALNVINSSRCFTSVYNSCAPRCSPSIVAYQWVCSLYLPPPLFFLFECTLTHTQAYHVSALPFIKSCL